MPAWGLGLTIVGAFFSLWAFPSLSVFLSGLLVLPFPLLEIVVASPCLQTQKHHSEVSQQGTEP